MLPLSAQDLVPPVPVFEKGAPVKENASPATEPSLTEKLKMA
ncbi:MAG: hypothetical protein JWM16_1596, partial [Verrucomicrobiales bacterium]|nr:hypothetical protein [Verrucomicrobiales bacterium]